MNTEEESTSTTNDGPQQPLTKTVGDLTLAFWTHVEDQGEPMPTGITCLDRVIGGGLKPKRLYGLLGGPNNGKTALSHQFAEHIATQAHPVIYVTLEEDVWALFARSISRTADLDYSDVQHKPEDCRLAISHALETINEQDLERYLTYVEDDCLLTLDALRTMAQQHFARWPGRSGLIVVDYLQRWARDVRSDGRDRRELREVVSFLLERLRRVAKDLNCAVLLLSSQNRGSGYGTADNDKGTGKTMMSAKESGDIEYGCDVLMAIQIKNMVLGGGWQEAALEIAKNRLGPRDITLPLRWRGSRQEMCDRTAANATGGKERGTPSSSRSDGPPPLRRKTRKEQSREFNENGREVKRSA